MSDANKKLTKAFGIQIKEKIARNTLKAENKELAEAVRHFRQQLAAETS